MNTYTRVGSFFKHYWRWWVTDNKTKALKTFIGCFIGTLKSPSIIKFSWFSANDTQAVNYIATSYFPESWNNNFLLLHQRKWKVGIYELFRSHQIASLIINNSWDIDFFVEIFFLCLFFFWQAPLRAQILNLPQILRSASSLSLFSSRVQGRTQVVCIKY